MPARAPEKRIVMFVGPTLASSATARKLARAFDLRRPVRRDDIAKLTEGKRKPGTVVIVDGVFHDTLAVGHAEIREALARGWSVWGLSSMGAIRAREMAHLGMRGFGQVYERFNAADDFQDDEVALLHEPAAPYRSVSEPLVHLRAAIAHLVALEIIAARDALAVVADLKSRWYGERTVTRAAHALKACPRVDGGAVDAELRAFDRFRLKTIDLVQFLEERPFMAN
jgi:hypothetical protein